MRALVIGAVTIAVALLGALLDAVWAAATEGAKLFMMMVIVGSEHVFVVAWPA